MVEFFQWLDRCVQAAPIVAGRLHHSIAVLDCASERGPPDGAEAGPLAQTLVLRTRPHARRLASRFTSAYTSPLKVRLAWCVKGRERWWRRWTTGALPRWTCGSQLKTPLMRWVGRSLAELSRQDHLRGKACALVTADKEIVSEVLRSAEEKHKHHVEEDENQVDLWAAGGDDYLLEADIPEVHLLEEDTGIAEVQAVPEAPVDEETFLGRLMAMGQADSVTLPTAALSGGEASYARLAANRLLTAA